MARYIFTLVFLYCNLSFAQVVSFKDLSTNLPLEQVSISSKKLNINTTTNTKGQANLSAFKTANDIDIQLLGYKPLLMTYAEIEQSSFLVLMMSSQLSLDELVVSASRANQNKREVPNKITSVSSKDVVLQNPQTVADLLATSGEVFIQKSQQGGGSPMIRGFSTNRLLYTVDGIRMNTAIFRAGNIQNVISLDAFAIENTEVFFGPGSVIYGSDAIGGVMSFRTLTPQLSAKDSMIVGGKAVMRYSTANKEKTAHTALNFGWKKWAFVSSVTYSDFDDLRMGNNNGPDDYLRPFYVQRINDKDSIVSNPNPLVQTPTGYTQINTMQKLRFKPNEHWDFTYGFHYSETSEYSRYDRLIEVVGNGNPRSAVWNYGPQKWMMNNLTVVNNQTRKLYNRMTIRLAQQYFEESRIDRNFSGGNRFRLRTQSEQVNAYSVNADFEKSHNKHRWFYGVEGVINDVISRGGAVHVVTGEDIPTPDRYPSSVWSSYAGYLNYQYKANDKLLLQSGARYSYYNIVSDFTRHLEFYPFDFTSSAITNDAVTGSIGAVITPSKTWTISANLATGFRAPNVDDIGKIFDFQDKQVVVPNPNLKAEYSYNAELNISKVFGDILKLDLTGFYTQLTNALVRREFTVNGQDSIIYNGEMSRVFAIQNAAFANVYGGHAGVEIKLPEGFSISSRFNYQLGVEEMDNGEISRSRHAAPWFGVSRISYKHKQLTAQIYTMYSGEVSYENLNEEERQKPTIYAKDDNDNPYSPGWYTLNAKMLYQFNKHFSASVGLENITDQRYRPYSSGLVAAGRNFIFSVRAQF
jgi:hemoglobin/transferrin/lactoferrin receptor protein